MKTKIFEFIKKADFVLVFVFVLLDYDGTHVKEISSSIITFCFLGGEEILFSEYDGTVQSYFVYDCKTNVKTLIKSIKQEIIEKEIALYK